jgi:hypothetical protein
MYQIISAPGSGEYALQHLLGEWRRGLKASTGRPFVGGIVSGGGAFIQRFVFKDEYGVLSCGRKRLARIWDGGL